MWFDVDIKTEEEAADNSEVEDTTLYVKGPPDMNVKLREPCCDAVLNTEHNYSLSHRTKHNENASHFVAVYGEIDCNYNPMKYGIKFKDDPEIETEVLCLPDNWFKENALGISIKTLLFRCFDCTTFRLAKDYLLMHTRARPFKCIYCCADFDLKSRLVSHIRLCNIKKCTGYERMHKIYSQQPRKVSSADIYDVVCDRCIENRDYCKVRTTYVKNTYKKVSKTVDNLPSKIKEFLPLKTTELLPLETKQLKNQNYICDICYLTVLTMPELIRHKYKHYKDGTKGTYSTDV